MSLVNFITEQVCKSSLFRLNIKNFTDSVLTSQVRKPDSASLHFVFGTSPCTESNKKTLMCRHNMSSSVFLHTFNFY